MDAVAHRRRSPQIALDTFLPERPSRAEVEAAVRTILRWTGEDPDRDGLKETPARVTKAYEEFFKGYSQDPDAIL